MTEKEYSKEELEAAKIQGEILATLKNLVESVKRIEEQLLRKMDKTEFLPYETKLNNIESDYEARLRKLESYKWKNIGINGTIIGVMTVLAQIITWLINIK